MTNWYAITTRPNCEAKAAAELRCENLLVWFPRSYTRISTKRWGEKPYYPRYLFLHTTSTRLWLVKRHRCQVITFGDDPPLPAIIPNDVMEVLRAGFDASGLALTKAEANRARFKAMQQVRFTDGPLRDALVRVIEDDGGDKIRVLLSMFGAERATTVRAADLQAA